MYLAKKLKNAWINGTHNFNLFFRQKLGANFRIRDLEIQNQQLLSLLGTEANVPEPPPKHLQIRVVGAYAPRFMINGFGILRNLDTVLKPVEKQIRDFSTVLDFGCGCGRVSRALKGLHPGVDLHGTDIDAEAINWLTQNYQTFGSFQQNSDLPPMKYPDDFFDFVFSISTLTHLPENMQIQWLKELRRITKVGGYLILTVHGRKYRKYLNRLECDDLDTKGFLYKKEFYTVGLPDFYQTAHHKPAYIERVWSNYFKILKVSEGIMDNHQDAVLLQKEGSPREAPSPTPEY